MPIHTYEYKHLWLWTLDHSLTSAWQHIVVTDHLASLPFTWSWHPVPSCKIFFFFLVICVCQGWFEMCGFGGRCSWLKGPVEREEQWWGPCDSFVDPSRLFAHIAGNKVLEDGRSIDANLGVFYSYTCFSLDCFPFHSPEGITFMFIGINASTNETLFFP